MSLFKQFANFPDPPIKNNAHQFRTTFNTSPIVDPIFQDHVQYEFSEDEDIDEYEEDLILTDDEENDGFDVMSEQFKVRPKFRIKTAVVRKQIFTSPLDNDCKEPYVMPSLAEKFAFNRLYLAPESQEKLEMIQVKKANRHSWIAFLLLAGLLLLVGIIVVVVLITGKKTQQDTIMNTTVLTVPTTNIVTGTTITTTTTTTTTTSAGKVYIINKN